MLLYICTYKRALNRFILVFSGFFLLRAFLILLYMYTYVYTKIFFNMQAKKILF